MSPLKSKFKRLLFELLGKDPDAVVVTFLSGDPARAASIAGEVRQLLPTHRHFFVAYEGDPTPSGGHVLTVRPASGWSLYLSLRRLLRPYRIGMAPVLLDADERYAPLRRAAFLLAPARILAYNARLERHHLKLRCWIASLLFLRGVPLDRIWLRPTWLCPWKRDRTVVPTDHRIFDGRPLVEGHPRIAVLTPYFPYPLSHGGAVRIFHLLREAAREYDIFLFAFDGGESEEDLAPVLQFCARAILVTKPRYREPRWSTLLPPEVHEYRSPTMQGLLDEHCREYNIQLRQVEYTYLARYRGDILVEHDVTFDLYTQIHERERTLAARWDAWRWKRFETRAVRRFRSVVVMSEKDAALLGIESTRVVGNGVDLDRFRPEPEQPGARLLFIGSFRHFPNILAFRYFTEQVWPRLRERFPDVHLTVVAGPDPLLYWNQYTGTAAPPEDPRIRLLGFVSDVRPLYVETNLVIVPTTVSAGTNLKVLEAMAMERAVVSTPSGCAGLGLEHGRSVWIADSPESFELGIAGLLRDPRSRREIALAARLHAERRYGWRKLGADQRALYGELLAAPGELRIRAANASDVPLLDRIQKQCLEASHWEPNRYLEYDCIVAVRNGSIAGFLVSRQNGPGEREILNIAVHPDARRSGVAAALLKAEFSRGPGDFFLEVRESNTAARNLYRKAGFEEVGTRPDYYDDPPETAVVMRIHS
ncbi:MAG: GNAT family N-acetyltransferase [Bryobacteraceae bacterium]